MIQPKHNFIDRKYQRITSFIRNILRCSPEIGIATILILTSKPTIATYDHDLYNDRLSYPKIRISLPVPAGWRSYRIESVSNILAEYQHIRQTGTHSAKAPLNGKTTAHQVAQTPNTLSEPLLATSTKDIDIQIIAAIDQLKSQTHTKEFEIYVQNQIKAVSQSKGLLVSNPHHIIHPIYDIYAVELSKAGRKKKQYLDNQEIADILQCFVRIRPDEVLIFTLAAENRSAHIPIYLQYIIDHMTVDPA